MGKKNTKNKKQLKKEIKEEKGQIGLITVQSITAFIFGLLLYLSIPATSIWSIAILPLCCGIFAWIAVKNVNIGIILGALIACIGSIFLSERVYNLSPQLSPGLFFIIQLVLGALPSIIIKLIKNKPEPKHIALCLLAILMLNFLVTASTYSTKIAQASAHEPPAEGYAFDGIFFLKMFYLTEKGMNFYKAFDIGYRQDSRTDQPPNLIGGWRMPTTFWLWSAIANRGNQLVYYFIFFTLILMLCSYLIAIKFTEHAYSLLSPCLIATYMLFGVSSWWYTELEYWGLFLALPAATLYLYNKRYLALLLAIVAGLMREWVALILIAGLINSIIKRRWLESISWALACSLIGIAYFVNMHNVIEYAKQANIPLLLKAGGTGQGGINFIFYTLQFGSTYFTNGVNFLYILFFIGIIGTIITTIRTKNFYWLIIIFLPLITYMFYGADRVPGDPPGTNDYYNINFMPYILVAVPFAAKSLVEFGLFIFKKIYDY